MNSWSGLLRWCFETPIKALATVATVVVLYLLFRHVLGTLIVIAFLAFILNGMVFGFSRKKGKS